MVFMQKKPRNWLTIIEYVLSAIVLIVLLYFTIGSNILDILNQNAIPNIPIIYGIIKLLEKSLHQAGV